MDADGVAEWIQTVLPDKTLAKQYADGLRDGFVDGDTMDTFPMGGHELTDYGIQKRHCRTILAKWAKLSSAGEGAKSLTRGGDAVTAEKAKSEAEQEEEKAQKEAEEKTKKEAEEKATQEAEEEAAAGTCSDSDDSYYW